MIQIIAVYNFCYYLVREWKLNTDKQISNKNLTKIYLSLEIFIESFKKWEALKSSATHAAKFCESFKHSFCYFLSLQNLFWKLC